MDDKGQERLDKLKGLPQTYEETPSIAQRAIEEILQRQKPKQGWLRRRWKAVAACAAAAVVALGVGIPLYYRFSTPQIVYYEENDVAYEEVENPTVFVEEKALNLLHFDTAAMLTTKSATIAQTGEFAFLEQSAVHMNAFGFFDKVTFWAVAKTKAEFSFYDNYQVLDGIKAIKDIDIKYCLRKNYNNDDNQVLAKFTYQKKDYFLDIVTELDGVQQLETYVNMLLN